MNGIWTLVACLEVARFAVLGSAEDSSSTLFLVSAPEVVHAGTTTSLAVFSDLPGQVTAEVAHGNNRVAQTQEFQEGVTSLLTLPPVADSIPHNSPLNLTVRGYRGDTLIFSNTTTVHFSLRNVSSFVQTNKLRYKPGDTVTIRVVSVQLDNRPYRGSVEISARDPSGNVVDRWESTESRGMVLRQFSLSQTAPVGQWTITTTINGVTEENAFTVAQHERPPFEVLVKTRSRVVAVDGLLASVRALHPGGEPVHGTLDVSVTLDPAWSTKASPVLLRQTKEIYGSAQFSFSGNELQTLATSSEGRDLLYVTACVTEHFTGRKVSKTVEVQQMRDAFQLKFHNHPSILKPSLHFSANLSVSRYDQKPLTSSDLMHHVVLEISQNGLASINTSTTRTFPVPEDGDVHIRFRLQDQVVILYLRARFQTSEETLTVLTNHSPSGSYIQISPVNTLPALIGFPLQLHVESTFQLTRLHYVVSSRGQVVAAGTRDSSSSFSLTPALSWSPAARVSVHCVLSDGEVTSDAVDVPINHGNSLSLKWSGAQARPGDQVSLTLTGLETDSQIAILVTRSDRDCKGEPGCDLKLLSYAGLLKKKLPDGSQYGEEEEEEEEEAYLKGPSPMVQKYWSHWMNAAEPFLWLDSDVSEETWTSEDVTVPDGASSLGATALVMSGNLGLRFTPVPQKLTVSKDFSLFLDVPAHLIRGEEIVLEVKVINHLEQDTEVIVLIAQSEAFEFVLTKRSGLFVMNAQKLTLGSQRSASALFPIRTLALGEMEISVDATSAEASESLSRRTTVKPEGVEQFYSQTLFLELVPGMDPITRPVSFSFPPDVVPGSQRAHMAWVGNILALSIHNMDSLVQMPVGCGEQNMVHFAPSAYALHYLNMSTHDDAEIRSAALSSLTQSYRRQLSYRRDDGSFSAFGSSDSSGSTWLTAFVLRCFRQAEPYVPIEQGVLDRARTWLLNHQGPDGEFREAGRVIHTELQAGLDADSVGLTAFVLVALLEDGSFACTGETGQEVEHPANVVLALKYLEGKVSSGGVSNYSLCVAAYALALAGSPVADEALKELHSRAFRDGVETWNTSSSRGLPPHSARVEMTSYMLLALLSRGGFVEGIGLMKWLTTQLSPSGGFGTTQDTVVALQALVCYAVYGGSDTIDLELFISPSGDSLSSPFHINSTNYRVHQSREINAANDEYILIMKGKGFAIFQLNVFYNLETGAALQSLHHSAFSLDVTFTGDSDHSNTVLSICTSLKDTELIAATGMVVMEIGVLSGFTLSAEAAAPTDLLRKVETTPHKVSLYLDSITKTQVCFQLPLVRKYKVAHTQDALVQVYDYYEPTRRAMASYNSPVLYSTDSCFFCGENCNGCWPGITMAVASHFSPAGPPCTSNWLLLALAVFLTAF